MNSNFLSMPHHLGEGTTLFKLKLIPSGDLTIRYYRAFFSLVRKDRGYMGKGLSHLEVQAEIFGGEIIQCLQFTLYCCYDNGFVVMRKTCSCVLQMLKYLETECHCWICICLKIL